MASAPEGARNQTAFRVAARLHELINAGWVKEPDAEGVYLDACRSASANGGSGFSDNEAMLVWRSAGNRTAGRAAVLPENLLGGSEFSVEGLPDGQVRIDTVGTPAPAVQADTEGRPAPGPHHGQAVGGGQDPGGMFESPGHPQPGDDRVPALHDVSGLALAGRIVTPDQLIATPPPEPLVRGLLNLNSGAWLIGAPGSYKSFVIISLAAAIGSGAPWLGVHQTTRRAVLYVMAEGVGGAGLRMEAWQARNGQIEGMFILPEAIQVDDVQQWSELVGVALQIDAGMIIIDTQSRVTVGLDENAAKDMGRYVKLVEALKAETGACILTVHHTNPDGNRGRGSTVQDGAWDSGLLLRRPAGTDMIAELTTPKQKDLPELSEAIRIQLEEVRLPARPGWPFGTSSLAVVGQAPPAREDDPMASVGSLAAQAAIVEAVSKCGRLLGLTKAETWAVTKPSGIDQPAFLAAWSEMVSTGLLNQSEQSKSHYVIMAPPGDGYRQGTIGGL